MITTRHVRARVTKILLGRPHRPRRVGRNSDSSASNDWLSSVAAELIRFIAAPDSRERSELTQALRGDAYARSAFVKYSGSTAPASWSTDWNVPIAPAILSHVSSVSTKYSASWTLRNLWSNSA